MANFLAMLRNRAVNDPGALKDLRQRADAGDAAAQRNIGLLYVYGWGVTQDYAEAMRWFRKAADQGYAAAQNYIGLLYGIGGGVGQDYVAAMRWYRKAADQGYAAAQNDIGVLYVGGLGVGQDYAEAMRWFRKAADQGNAEAQNGIGVLYLRGLGVGQDYAEAMRRFRKAAEHGNVEALDYIRKHGPCFSSTHRNLEFADGCARRSAQSGGFSGLLEHSIRHGAIPDHPSRGVSRLAGNRRERRLTSFEDAKPGVAMLRDLRAASTR